MPDSRSWKAQYIRNLERILDEETFNGKELLALLELEKRLQATIEDHVRKYSEAPRFSELESMGNPVADAQHLKDLYIMAFVDGVLFSQRRAFD